MTFMIVAELPLGTYRGSGQDGRPERLPSVARLHAALLCAAGFGPRAVTHEGAHLRPCEADEVALRWLEDHPPAGVQIPALELAPGRAVAYRDDGTLKKSKTLMATKKSAKPSDAGTAVGGQFVWTWHEAPPPPVREALEALCPDVPYLGTTESPVRLTTSSDSVEVNYELDPTADMFTVGTLAIDRPLPGRLAELTAAHVAGLGSPPSAARDRYGTDEKSQSPTPPRTALEAVRYRGRDTTSRDVPWTQVLLLPLNEAIPEQDRVGWAVAAHRALIRLVGAGAPSLVTGVYPNGVRQPSNRVALHILDSDMAVAEGAAASSPATLAVLVPGSADPADIGVLFAAVEKLSSVRGPGGRIRRVDLASLQALPGDRFWRAPDTEVVRLWSTSPPAIPDTRGARDREWTFAHAALLSLAFVWKDGLPRVRGRGDAYHAAMAAAVAERGAAVVHVSAVRGSTVGRYVHRVNDHAVIRPYRACLWLGDLAGSRTVQAIGQSRHLGGGLLVPFDIPAGAPASEVLMPYDSGSSGGS